ncbi:TetR family transcriptional regulator, partial [Escherichia coli]|uniref:TetR family transcriptional regulator n=1 Tax=Escherichia coli TaxID=562 RepID=UPI00201AC1E2
MARKTKQEAQETRQHILDVALRLFSQQGVSSTSLGEIAKAAGVTRGAIYWHFKDKSDLFSEIWELSESNIGELELEYQAKFPGDPLSVLREILIHVLESGNDSNLLIVFYVQIMPDDFVMQLHR